MYSEDSAGERMRLRLSNVIAGLAIGTIASGQFLTPEVPTYFAIAALGMAAIAAAALSRFKSFNIARALLLTGLCVGPLFVSITLNGGGFDQAASPFALTIFALSAYVFGRIADEDDWRQVLTIGTIFGIACFFGASAYYGWDIFGSVRSGTRIDTGIHPNLFGLTALTVFLLAAASKNRILWALCFGVAIIACVAASSRAALLTVLLAFGAARLLASRRQPAAIIAALVTALFAVTIALLFAGPWLGWLADSVFHVNDNYRGVASGGSGRLRLWSHFLEAWLRQPLFGPGPGTALEMHGRAVYSHNLILQILTDSGFVGLVCFGAFMIAVLLATSRQTSPPTLRASATLGLISYVAYGLFEGRAINVGNPLSATFFFLTFAVLGANDPLRTRLNSLMGKPTESASICRASRPTSRLN